MPDEQVSALEKKITDFNARNKPTEFPPEIYSEIKALPDEDAMELAARVKREVRNKLTTGLKNPRKKK